MTRPDSSDLRIRDETQKSPFPASAERGACVTFDCKNRRTSRETSFSRENRKEREVESHTRKSLTVKCCARFRHNTYFLSESSGLAAVITGRPNARHARPRKNGHRPDGRRGRSDHATFRPLATAAASRTIARTDLPAPSWPILPDALTRVLTSRARRRPTSGQARKWVISTHGGKRSGAPMRRHS